MISNLAINLRSPIRHWGQLALLAALLLLAGAPCANAEALLSPWAIQKAIGRGGNALLGNSVSKHKTRPGTASRRKKQRKPTVGAGDTPPLPRSRPSLEADMEARVQENKPQPQLQPLAERPERPEPTPPQSSTQAVAPTNVETPVPASKAPPNAASTEVAVPRRKARREASGKKQTGAVATVAGKPTGGLKSGQAKTSGGGAPVGALCLLAGIDALVVEQSPPNDPACSIAAPVALRTIGDDPIVRLRPKALLACDQAQAVSRWVDEVVAPAADALLGSPLKSIRVAASFVCRRRNNLPTGKLSEHAWGKAIDISAFTLKDGRVITVEEGWHGATAEKKFLARVRKKACERFTTVLSPDGDAYHQDHLHLDIGCHGKTCSYRICH